jgi:hypothetical protein
MQRIAMLPTIEVEIDAQGQDACGSQSITGGLSDGIEHGLQRNKDCSLAK